MTMLMGVAPVFEDVTDRPRTPEEALRRLLFASTASERVIARGWIIAAGFERHRLYDEVCGHEGTFMELVVHLARPGSPDHLIDDFAIREPLTAAEDEVKSRDLGRGGESRTEIERDL